jgi:hypothetical protein
MRLSSTLLALAAVLAMTSTAQAATTSGTANATVIAPLAITAVDSMEFGNITPPSSGSGTVASSVDAPTGGVGQFGTRRDGTFTVTGDSSLTYNTTGSDTLLSLIGPGGNTLDGTLTLTSASGGSLAGGPDTLSAKGVLNVTSTKPAGAYNGSYNVTVNYN